MCRRMTRRDLYRLIDRLPESELPIVKAYLEGLERGAKVSEYLDSCPYDDEELTDQELEQIDVGLEEVRRGDTVSLEEFKRQHGFR